MNEYERQRRIAESTKKLYPPGTRIELINTVDFELILAYSQKQ
ncbi:MAG: hypothetical protein ACI4F6_01935 [Acutalibacteraceae bacterium]